MIYYLRVNIKKIIDQLAAEWDVWPRILKEACAQVARHERQEFDAKGVYCQLQIPKGERRHLQKLSSVGLIEKVPEGKADYYRIPQRAAIEAVLQQYY